jgi:large subunit ribosomal protein L18
VFRSLRCLYAQVIDDDSGRVLAAANSREPGVLGGVASPRTTAAAQEVGRAIAERAKAASVTRVVFDRGGYLFHGRVRAIAQGAREAGLDF